jgi:hypothetical protein
MGNLAAVLVAALLGLTLVGTDAGGGAESFLRPLLGPAGSGRVVTERAPDGRAADFARIAVSLDRVDVRRLPLAVLLPRPVPRSPKGRIGSLEVRATNARLDSLRASEVACAARDVHYDLPTALDGRSLRVTALGEHRLSVLLRNGDLDAWFAEQYPELIEPRLTFEQGRLVAKAKVPLVFVAFGVTISGVPALAQQRQVVLREIDLQTGRLELAPELRRRLLARLEVLLDLDQAFALPVPVVWTGLTTGDGWCRLTARLDAVETPRPAPAFQPRERYQ